MSLSLSLFLSLCAIIPPPPPPAPKLARFKHSPLTTHLSPHPVLPVSHSLASTHIPSSSKQRVVDFRLPAIHPSIQLYSTVQSVICFGSHWSCWPYFIIIAALKNLKNLSRLLFYGPLCEKATTPLQSPPPRQTSIARYGASAVQQSAGLSSILSCQAVQARPVHDPYAHFYSPSHPTRRLLFSSSEDSFPSPAVLPSRALTKFSRFFSSRFSPPALLPNPPSAAHLSRHSTFFFPHPPCQLPTIPSFSANGGKTYIHDLATKPK